jgi:hypothetical protein
MTWPLQIYSNVNSNIGGKKGWAERKEETAEELEKRKAGQQRAEEREMVRKAARRRCAFGLKLKDKPETARLRTVKAGEMNLNRPTSASLRRLST